MKPVMIAHSEPEQLRGLLQDRFPGAPLHFAANPEELRRTLADVDPEVVFSIKQDSFPAPTHRPIVEHPSVRWIQVGGSGYEHLQPWDGDRITVTNCAGVLAAYLAETVTAAILSLNSHFVRYAAQQRDRLWQRIAFQPLAGQTLLVVGLGAIGGRVAGHAKALGMRVIATRQSGRPHPDADEIHPPEALPALLGRADFVSLHLRLTEATRHLIDREALTAMKPGAFLLNSARGPVIDETALIQAIESGHLGGAYLDVFETEPLPAESPLWGLPNVLITPHTADNIEGWETKFASFFADNLDRWLAGEPLANLVSP